MSTDAFLAGVSSGLSWINFKDTVRDQILFDLFYTEFTKELLSKLFEKQWETPASSLL